MHHFRTASLALLLCSCLQGFVFDRAAAETFDEHRKLVEPKLAALADSDDRNDFDDAVKTLIQVLQKPEQNKKFEYAGLFAKLLCEVDLRIDSLHASETATSPLGGGLLGSGLPSGDGSPAFGDLALGQSKDKGSNKEGLNAQQRTLQRYLPKFSLALSRNLYLLYRTGFSGQDDLKQILEKATDDDKHRKVMFDRLSAEFSDMDEKYFISSGKLIPRKGKR